ncbi:leucine-rich repeat protein [Faecalibacterium sp. I2-3-92]|uniref:leucine-rich repeat protein n=1 Tax=Faecalibacterium sp. I2-3-92 TaxID=2929490 RepID=UPI002014F5CD|nr:leucine-rich repeat protein [Faecalibacterium sp. I2-3-92]UQK48609.1 leucine-rich repeat protein [Faecalibacterium sp. I2-3-92]
MKKRLISLLVALCMAVTLLPVSALTAWAEGGGQLKIVDGYPVGSGKNHDEDCSGDGWSYDGSTQTLDLHPASSTEYDFFSIISGYGNVTKCKLTIGGNATIVRGNFDNAVINNGKISGGYFFSSSSSLINHGSITGGKFLHAISNESSGTIENGTFISVTNNGTINGGIFRKKPEGGHVAKGYTLNVNLQNTGIYKISRATINGLNGGCYIIPNSDHDTSVTIEYTFSPISQPILFPIDVTFGDTNGTPCLLKDWAPSASYSTDHAPSDSFFVTFTAPSTGTDTVTLSMLTRLVIDENGYPVGPMGSNKKYSGNGWNFDASNNTLTLTNGSYDFSGEENALRPLNPDVQLVVESGAKLTGGAAGDGSGVTWQLTENTDNPSTYTLTIRGSGAMEDYLMSGHQPWRSFRDQITSVVVSPGVTSIGQCAFSRFAKLTHVDIADSVISIGWDAFYYCSSLTNITIPQSVTYIGPLAFFHCTNLSSITLSNNITSIGSSAFEDCTNLTSITIPGSVTSIGLAAFCNCTKLTSITIPDSVTTIDLEAFKNCSSLTSITIPGSVTSIGPYVFDGCTSLNDIRYSGTSESVISALSGYVPTLVTFDYGDKVPEAKRMITVSVKTGETLTAPTTIPTVSGYEFKGWRTKDGKPYDFTVAPTGKFTLYANWEKIPDPKPEPKPEPEPEAPTYTLTVKGGTFTYNGGEAMTSASVPVDAEVKVTLNQSAVPEGMVFDLWAMDEASLLGNPAVAYNEESFTIPAGSVAKGSTVTVEAQYRDATIESEPSILGTAAIIGVAGAGTAVIVWQGYRIGMELYEKYFQPTPEETAAEQPAPEAPAAAAAS